MRQAALTMVLATWTLVGCASTGPSSPYEPASEVMRNSLEAQELTQKATRLMDNNGDVAEIERLLREALAADLYHGPAHNNLGVLYLQQGKLYEAASEFEWARKLMPGHPDPRMNLAIVFEQAGRTDDALTTYATALEVYPNHMPTLQALTRCQIRYGRDDDTTRSHLEEIAFRGETEQWRDWARLQLLRLDHP